MVGAPATRFRQGRHFITLEDETAVANLVVWTKISEKYRRVVLGSGMIGGRGRVQREGDVVWRKPSFQRRVL
jgi:error-prone DNA polymerase